MYDFLLVVCSNSFRDISTFILYVTVCILEQFLSFDHKITSHMHFPIHGESYRSYHILYFPRYKN